MEQISKKATKYVAVAVDEVSDYTGDDTVSRERLKSLRSRTEYL
jgi:hypothetical protein